MIRKATLSDLPSIVNLFDEIHTAEEAGIITTGWQRGVYPTEATARAALGRDDLFVMEEENENGQKEIIGSGVINQLQVDVYEGAPWEYPAPPEKVTVFHTLMISPKHLHKGYGSRFIAYYEQYARDHGCPYLRIDTNERNLNARALYKKLGYKEIAIVPTVFNGIAGVGLVLLEKYAG